MTAVGFVFVFEGDFADMYPAGVDGGLSGGLSVHRSGSEDPDWCQWKLYDVKACTAILQPCTINLVQPYRVPTFKPRTTMYNLEPPFTPLYMHAKPL